MVKRELKALRDPKPITTPGRLAPTIATNSIRQRPTSQEHRVVVGMNGILGLHKQLSQLKANQDKSDNKRWVQFGSEQVPLMVIHNPI
jgi:hypothetical protein